MTNIIQDLKKNIMLINKDYERRLGIVDYLANIKNEVKKEKHNDTNKQNKNIV